LSVLRRRLEEVRYRVAAACARARRDPASVALVAVSKTVPAELVLEAVAAGQGVFGENRVQEALPKIAAAGPAARWHLVGHLQRNKAKLATGAFDLIHSVDDAELAREIDTRAAAKGLVQRVLIQVNMAGEETKSGAAEDGLRPLVEAVAALPHLRLDGLMTIPPPADDPEASRPWFRRLRELRDRISESLSLPLPDLSMGMTDDFEPAIEEGATLVRVGRAIFGERA